MGIKGLTAFLDSNSQLLTDYRLRDTKVIIDGNNLFHFLNNLYGVDDTYGGDYDHFASATFSFFGTLEQCNVTPVILFDGPYIPSEKKIGTSVKRARERIGLAYQLTLGLQGRATPLFCQDVFVSCLDAMSVKHVTCDGEADGEIAALANLYQCPVMTNDSDFFIFDIKAGVILLDYVNLRIRRDGDQTAKNKSTRYINVQVYYHKKLTDFFKLDADRLALFGTMLGNDRVDKMRFQPFFASERLPDPGSKRTKIHRVLLWLGEVESLENAINRILSHYKMEMRQELQQIISESVSNYRSIGESHVNIPNDLSMGRAENVLLSFAGHPPPDWFLDEMHRARMSTLVTNTLTSRKVILLAQPENFTLKSAHECAKFLRRIIYGIVLQHDIKFHNRASGSVFPCSSDCAIAADPKKLLIEEMDRDRRSQKRSLIDPVFNLNGMSMPSLAEIHHMTQTERLSLLCLAFGVRLDNVILRYCPKDLQLYLICVSYWINHAEPKVNVHHLTTVLLCLVKLGAVDHLASLEQTNYKDPPSGNASEADCTDVLSEKIDCTDVSPEKTDCTDVSSENFACTDVSSEKTDSTDVLSEKTDSTDVLSEKTDSTDVSSKKTDSTDVSSKKTDSTDVPSEKTDSTDVLLEKTDSTDVSSEKFNYEDVLPEKEGKTDVSPEKTDCTDVFPEKYSKTDCTDVSPEKIDCTDVSCGKTDCTDVSSEKIDCTAVSPEKTDCTNVSSENLFISEEDTELFTKSISTGSLQDFIKSHCPHEKICSAKIFLDKFKRPKLKAKSRSLAVLMDVDVLHVFAELQSCMLAAQALNELLKSPLARIPVSEVFCGTFLFYFYRELKARKKPDAYVCEALGQSPLMSGLVKVMRKLVMDTVQDNVIITNVTPTRRRTKKKKGKAPEMIHRTPSDDEADFVKDDNDDVESKLVAECDLVNRFGCLMQETPSEF